ncbi:MAG: acylphosphatase [Nevskiales bacterium]|nr:acylphosphatase [Nevskiales bacterium]
MIQDTQRQTCRGFVVSGRVQGVGFRAATRDQARRLGLTGWVRNRSDGCVEGVALGQTAPLDTLVEWLHQGPAAARVESVWFSDAVEDDSLGGGFEIR